jgi:glucokinase
MESSDSGCTIALDVGGTSVKSGLVRAGAVLTTPITTPLDQAGPAEAILGTFGGVLALHLRELAGRPLLGVALGFPAPFDYPAGVCLMRHKFAALYGQNIRAALGAGLPDPSLPVLFRNDAEAAIVGEARYGVGRRYRRLIGLTLGTGLGSAFLDAGKPVKEGASIPPLGELYAQPALGASADDAFSIRGLTARPTRARPTFAPPPSKPAPATRRSRPPLPRLEATWPRFCCRMCAASAPRPCCCWAGWPTPPTYSPRRWPPACLPQSRPASWASAPRCWAPPR